MKLKWTTSQGRVDVATARRRVLRFLESHKGLANPSRLADSIWPEHQMNPQGAGGAASRILRPMEAEGLICYAWDRDAQWGGYRLPGRPTECEL